VSAELWLGQRSKLERVKRMDKSKESHRIQITAQWLLILQRKVTIQFNGNWRLTKGQLIHNNVFLCTYSRLYDKHFLVKKLAPTG